MKTMVRQVTRAPKLGLLLSAITYLGALIAFGAVLSPTVAIGESGLPSCPAGEMASWTDCQGTSTYPNGGTYVGEFRDGKAQWAGDTHVPSPWGIRRRVSRRLAERPRSLCLSRRAKIRRRMAEWGFQWPWSPHISRRPERRRRMERRQIHKKRRGEFAAIGHL